jgi:hypothetical protein
MGAYMRGYIDGAAKGPDIRDAVIDGQEDAYKCGFLDGAVKGLDIRDFAVIDVPERWLLPDLLTAVDLAKLFHVDERTVRNHATYSLGIIFGGCIDLPQRPRLKLSPILRRSDDGDPWLTTEGSSVAIARWPIKQGPGRPKADDGWRFQLAHPNWCPPHSMFYVPDWVRAEDSARG